VARNWMENLLPRKGKSTRKTPTQPSGSPYRAEKAIVESATRVEFP